MYCKGRLWVCTACTVTIWKFFALWKASVDDAVLAHVVGFQKHSPIATLVAGGEDGRQSGRLTSARASRIQQIMDRLRCDWSDIPPARQQTEKCCNERTVARPCSCRKRFNPTTLMISNERPSPYGDRSYGYSDPRPRPPEDVLKSEQIQVERKTFILSLKENPRGRFLRITEDVGGRRDNIMIPASGLEEFRRVFDEMVKQASEIPEQKPQNLA